jgi:hypothetical protein
MAIDLSEDERLALHWLHDENQIQRTISKTTGGKKLVREDDVSGGHVALLRILRSDAPLNISLRHALANALDPFDDSLLQLKKRLRRSPGRPSRFATVEGAVADAYDVHVIPDKIEEEKERITRKRPQPAVGMKSKPVRNDEVMKNLGVGRTRGYELKKRKNDENRRNNREK